MYNNKMYYNDKMQREVFHFLFLERLLKISDPKLYILKGGVNFRFFFQSPRYSEDIDLDVIGGSVQTLKKNGYKILEDASFIRSLRVFGISAVRINDKSKAKQSETTQRFRLRIVNEAGEEFPTKVEFSRRESIPTEPYSLDVINPKIALQFKRLSYSCYHYQEESAVIQKIRALGGRSVTQARDVFDLYMLYIMGYLSKEHLIANVSQDERKRALTALESLNYQNYLGQVVEFLDLENKPKYQTPEIWGQMIHILKECLDE